MTAEKNIACPLRMFLCYLFVARTYRQGERSRGFIHIGGLSFAAQGATFRDEEAGVKGMAVVFFNHPTR